MVFWGCILTVLFNCSEASVYPRCPLWCAPQGWGVNCLPAVSWACGFSSPRVISLLVGWRKQNVALGFPYEGKSGDRGAGCGLLCAAPGEQRVALCSPQHKAWQVRLAAHRLRRHSRVQCSMCAAEQYICDIRLCGLCL